LVDDLSPIGLGKSTESIESLSRVRQWISDCETKRDENGSLVHESCSMARNLRQNSPFLPTRLLDLGQGTSVVKLVESKEANINNCENYITLSHCWGTHPVLSLLPETKAIYYKDGIRDTTLPRTFRQAVWLARQLKISYVWIDSLCIVQDNIEFAIEGQYMHKVYRNSYLNLSAAFSVNSLGGLFKERSLAEVGFLELSLPGSKILGDEPWYMFRRDLWEHQLLKQPLYKRGWAFQERMLSPRLLHFAEKQIFWDCPTISACETIPKGLPLLLDDLAGAERHWRERLQFEKTLPYGTADVSVQELWVNAVQSYTSCSLTKPDDKLLAVWGIAKTVKDLVTYKNDYAAGMWNSTLYKQLAWRVVDCKKARRLDTISEKYVPTWSWASMHENHMSQGCEIFLSPHIENSREPIIPVRNHDGTKLAFEVDDNSTSTDIQPHLKSPILALQGHIFQAFIVQTSAEKWSLNLENSNNFQDRFEVFPGKRILV
jgi:hypothetical protein